jgi:hypothetical protein
MLYLEADANLPFTNDHRQLPAPTGKPYRAGDLIPLPTP